jgi:hypothetical protein
VDDGPGHRHAQVPQRAAGSGGWSASPIRLLRSGMTERWDAHKQNAGPCCPVQMSGVNSAGVGQGLLGGGSGSVRLRCAAGGAQHDPGSQQDGAHSPCSVPACCHAYVLCTVMLQPWTPRQSHAPCHVIQPLLCTAHFHLSHPDRRWWATRYSARASTAPARPGCTGSTSACRLAAAMAHLRSAPVTVVLSNP